MIKTKLLEFVPKVLILGVFLPLASVASTNQAKSVFNHNDASYVKSTDSKESDYVDTEFGDYLYCEASVATRLEALRMLSKGAPLDAVLLQGLSMGLGIDDLVAAAVRYKPEIRREVATSAISILPILEQPSNVSKFTRYSLEDLEKESALGTYSVAEVAKRFFENRAVLTPAPDWPEGQYAFDASAKELLEISQGQNNELGKQWYYNQSSQAEQIKSKRPVFVSFYQDQMQIAIDDLDRVKKVAANSSNGLVPVVFIFNHLNERPVELLTAENSDRKTYPRTITGIHEAYTADKIMVTAVPEWQQGDYHILAKVEEVKALFEIPEQDDFDSEHWKRLLSEARRFEAAEISFVSVMLPHDSDIVDNDGQRVAVFNDPRVETDFPYIIKDGKKPELKDLIDKGIFMLRLDLIAALDYLGVQQVPVSFFYVDDARTQKYRGGIKAIEAIVSNNTGVNSADFGGKGGFAEPSKCASPPCSN